MIATFSKLWRDDNGALLSAEYLFMATILVIGLVVGLAGVRDAINVELTELGNAFLALSQGFSINGTGNGNGNGSDGSSAIDTPTKLTPPTSVPPAISSVIDVTPN